MFRSLAKPRMVLTRRHWPSKSHHTTDVCGYPSGVTVVSAATGRHWARSRWDAGISSGGCSLSRPMGLTVSSPPGGRGLGTGQPAARRADRHPDLRIAADALDLAGGGVGLHQEPAVPRDEPHRGRDAPAVALVAGDAEVPAAEHGRGGGPLIRPAGRRCFVHGCSLRTGPSAFQWRKSRRRSRPTPSGGTQHANAAAVDERAAVDLGAFQLADLWADRTAWPITEWTAYDELAGVILRSIRRR